MTAFLSGTVLPLLLAAAGVWFAVGAGRHLLRHARRACGALRGGGGLRELSVALAGTLGVGNIAGVATAIALGGPGAVFWMWVAALLAAFVKYAEIVLAMRTVQTAPNGRVHGGAMYYIKVAFGGRAGALLAAVFALLCLLCALTLGGMIQSSAVAEAAGTVWSMPPLAVGLGMALAAAFVIWRGKQRVEAVCTALVPLMCLLFTAASVAVLVLRWEALPAAFEAILQGAFDAKSASAGALGLLGSKAMRYGVARGLVSNEAGCGTAPIAHASAPVKQPAAQGMWGIVEVLVDTILLCTLTALVILVSGVPLAGEGGTAMAMAAFGAVLGAVAPHLLAIAVLFFAFATVLCWSHYGSECLLYLTGSERFARLMVLATPLSCLIGAVAAPALAWELTDVVLACMALLNVTALLICRHAVVAQTRALTDP